MAGMKQTGRLDYVALIRMREPQCGVADFPSKWFELEREKSVWNEVKWVKQAFPLTWRLGRLRTVNRKGQLSRQEMECAIRKAFASWASIASVTF